MVTPSGRLEVGKKLCLSMTDFHPESWNPAWSVETILVGLLSFFVSDAEEGYGAIKASEERRRKLAAEADAINSQDADFRALFPEMLSTQEVAAPSVIANANQVAPESSSTPEAAGQVVISETTGRDSQSLSTVNDNLDLEAPQECWICRDTDSTEPLIQPCACRGSMSGVHASCVEEWVRHHRQNAINNAAPRCSVCHQPYSGQEVRPGVVGFVRYFGFFGGLLFLRSVVLVVLLVLYTSAADDGDDKKDAMPLAARIVSVILFSIAGVHKILVITVSLPFHRPPPDRACLRILFVADYRKLLVHIFEAYYVLFILTVVALFRWPHPISMGYYVPFFFAGLLPIAKGLHASLQGTAVTGRCCLDYCRDCLFFCVACPCFLLQNVIRSCHPLDGGLHALAASAIVPMAWCLQSNLALVILWTVHSFLVTVALAERLMVKRFTWKQGRSWIFAMQTVLVATYVTNCLCVFEKGVGAPNHTTEVTACVSLLWMLLVGGLGLNVNWDIVMQFYLTWQNRNGNFRLGGGSSTAVAPLVSNTLSMQPLV
jgi:hypothetical protein